MKFSLTCQITRFFVSELYIRFTKASNESCDNAPILLTISRREVLNFFLSYKVRELETGNALLFKLSLEMQFILTSQTRRVFASG